MHYFTAHRTAFKTYAECDIVEQTVGRSPGYRVTIAGYSATAIFGRGINGWDVTLSAPGHPSGGYFLPDNVFAKYVVMEQGAALLAEYIVKQGVPRRTGRVTPDVPVGSPCGERQLDRAKNPRRKLFGR